MGSRSTAKIPIVNKVNTGNEICLNAIATAYDALNGKMLTRQLGVYDQANIKSINGKFHVLRMLCSKHAPSKLIVIDRIHKITTDNLKGIISDQQAINMLQQIINNYNLNPNLLNIAAIHINQAEEINFDPFGINMFYWIGNNNNNVKTKKKRRNRYG